MPGKRELIEPNKGDKRYVRRDEIGRFDEVDDVGRSSAQDQKRKAKNKSKPGYGDQGDRGDGMGMTGIMVGLVLIALVIVGFVMFFGDWGSSNTTVKMDAPKVQVGGGRTGG